MADKKPKRLNGDLDSQKEEDDKKSGDNKRNELIDGIVCSVKDNLEKADRGQDEVSEGLKVVQGWSSLIGGNINSVVTKLRNLLENLEKEDNYSSVQENKQKFMDDLHYILELLENSKDLNKKTLVYLQNIKERALGVTGFIRNAESGVSEKCELSSEYSFEDKICGLTGVPNKDAYNLTIESLINENKKFHIVLLDLNNFKEINDKYGYLAGDQLLAEFARRMKKHLDDQQNRVFRWGGDEFAVISFDEPTQLIQKIFGLFRMSDNFQVYSLKSQKNLDSISVDFSNSLGYFDPEIHNYNDFFNKLNEYLLEKKRKGKVCPILKEVYRKIEEENDDREIEQIIRSVYFEICKKSLYDKLDIELNEK